MYELLSTKSFDQKYKQITKKDHLLAKRIQKILKFLQQDPFYPSLNSHKAQTSGYGERWSSWVTGDIRIIWDFDDNDRLIILLLDIGGHTGATKVYK